MTVFLETLKKAFALTLLGAFLVISVQAIPVARAVDATFNVTLTVDAEIAINGTTVGTTTLTDIALLPNISLSNDVASNSQNDIQIETTDPDGYTLTLHATSSPALQHDTTGTDISNHTNGGTPGNWNGIGANSTEFGFGVFSSSGGGADTDIVDSFEDPDSNGTRATACLGLAANTAPTYANLANPVGFAAAPLEGSAITIASRGSATAGPTDIDICFYVQANNDSPDAGSYTATIVLRATVQ